MDEPAVSVLCLGPSPEPRYNLFESVFFPQFLEKMQTIDVPRGKTVSTFEEFELAMLQVLSDFNPTSENHNVTHTEDQVSGTTSLQVMKLLTAHTYDSLLHEVEYCAALFEVLAVASRGPPWRHYFGRRESQVKEQHEILAQAEEPDCVLEVARRVITLSYGATSAMIKSSLKIIANCGAAGSVNCELIVRRRGLESLLRLSRHDTDLNTLVPTLFNVCTEFEEDPQCPLETTENPDIIDETFAPRTVSDLLAEAYRSNRDFSTFELLLTFSDKIPRDLWGYLGPLILMALRPVLRGFEYIRHNDEVEQSPWTWSFAVDGRIYDTITLALTLGDHDECNWCISVAVSYLLSQQEARHALLQRQDDSIWRLLTIACGTDPGLFEGEEGSSDYISVRTALLKTLYQITGDPSFCQGGDRASALIGRTIDHLQSRLQDDEDSSRGWQSSPRGTGHSFQDQTACVILSQLAASNDVREQLCDHRGLHEVLSSLLSVERNPDVLYPAVTIVSRLALSPRKQLLFENYSTLQAMQQLLTTKGLGLIVPFETVTSYKTVCRGRPAISVSLLNSGDNRRHAVATDALALWVLTIEAATKLEIGKLFLEILRTMVSIYKPDGAYDNTVDEASAMEFEKVLSGFAERIAEVFAWMCTSAEPGAQRVHGWFGLAMLSIWTVGRQCILPALEQHHIRDAIVNASALEDGPVPNNLKLMLNNIQSASFDQVPPATLSALETAASKLGLKWSPS